VPDDPDRDDVYVPAAAVRPPCTATACWCEIERQRRRERLQGSVVKVLVRGTTRIIGVLRRGKTTAVVVPQEQRITVPILVPKGARGGAADWTWWSRSSSALGTHLGSRSASRPSSDPLPTRASRSGGHPSV
jgi:exoribonuclease R